MTEEKVKKRGWVKNAAIIFLAVMLVLTFFSNTIMNHSLPEVAAQYVQSGSINAKIRGSGQVSANESFEVKSTQTRKVESVPVKVGDKVEVGDTLLFFADAESADIKTAQNELDELVLAYQLKLVDISDGAYAKETRAVNAASAALEKAKADRDASYVSDADMQKAKDYADTCAANVKKQEDLIAELQKDVGTGSTTLEDAEKSLETAMLIYGYYYKVLVEQTNEWMRRNDITSEKDQNENRAVYMAALVEKYKIRLAKPDAETYSAGTRELTEEGEEEPTVKLMATTLTEPQAMSFEYMTEMVEAYKNVKAAQDAVEAAKGVGKLTDAKVKLVELNRTKTNADEALTKLKDKQTEYKAADATVDAKETALETALEALASAQSTDKKTNLQLQADKEKIDAKRQALADLKAGGSGASLTSEVAGIVKSIEITAGKTAEASVTLMTVEIPEKGYGVSFSVPIEKSKKVKVGDEAEVSGNYWGSKIQATLVGIKTDPQNPGTQKILRFKLSGDVESGSTISISIGERGGNYDSIIPTSAIRTDNNGDFVLVVISKSSPLGNRFMAQRVDVKVQASDDVNSAVSGGLSYSDMVITTSNKPIQTGMLVRLPDN